MPMNFVLSPIGWIFAASVAFNAGFALLLLLMIKKRGGIRYVLRRVGLQSRVQRHSDNEILGLDPPYYHRKKEALALLPKHEKSIVFLGDSITEGCEWAELFSHPHIRNRGIGGDTTTGVMARLKETVGPETAKVFLMIGTNDLIWGREITVIAENVKKIVRQIKRLAPEATVYIQSLLPVNSRICGETLIRNQEIVRLNSELRSRARSSNALFIDLHSKFISTKTGELSPEYTLDGLHLNGKGYLLWKELIRSCMEKS